MPPFTTLLIKSKQRSSLARLLPQAVRFPFEDRRLVQVNRLASFLKRLTDTQQTKTQLFKQILVNSKAPLPIALGVGIHLIILKQITIKKSDFLRG